MGFGVLHHLINFLIGQTGGGLDLDGLLFAGGLVFRAHVQNTVGVDVEGHFDLRHAARCRRNVFQVELAQRLVLCRLLTLTLQHMHGHGGLVVIRRREHLGRIGRDGGVLLDQRRHHTAHGFDTQG